MVCLPDAKKSFTICLAVSTDVLSNDTTLTAANEVKITVSKGDWYDHTVILFKKW